jgi:hypothetical protein
MRVRTNGLICAAVSTALGLAVLPLSASADSCVRNCGTLGANGVVGSTTSR